MVEQLKKLTPADLVNLDKIDSLSQLEDLQGEFLTYQEAEALARLREKFIVDSLQSGFGVLDTIEDDPDGELARPFAQQLGRFKKSFNTIRKLNEDDTEGLNQMCDSLLATYETIYGSECTEQEKLFLEFIAGLAFSEINARIGLAVAKKMTELSPDVFAEHKDKIQKIEIEKVDDRLVEGLKPGFTTSEHLVRIMNTVFQSDSEGYWSLYTQALKEIPGLEEVAKKVVSMRAIPHEPADRSLVSIAQSLHFRGFGSDGELLKRIPKLNRDWILAQCIGWHKTTDPFTDKLLHFKRAIGPLKAHEAEVIGKLFEGNEKSEIKIFDAGAGPFARGSHLIAKKLENAGKRVGITASEVDGNGLQKLSGSLGAIPSNDEKLNLQNTKIEDVRYWDFNQKWNGSPEDRYDLFVFSVTLHQVMDAEQGHEQVGEALRVATQATREGGCISWSDAGELAYIQSQMLVANVVDREGCVPPDIFTRISFESVKTEASTAQEDSGEAWYKIPYPLREHRFATPQGVAKRCGAGIYEYNVFKILTVPQSIIKKLDAEKNPNERDEIIAPYLHPEVLDASREGVAEQALATLED